jgi:hypothetical protein
MEDVGCSKCCGIGNISGGFNRGIDDPVIDPELVPGIGIEPIDPDPVMSFGKLVFPGRFKPPGAVFHGKPDGFIQPVIDIDFQFGYVRILWFRQAENFGTKLFGNPVNIVRVDF